MRVRVIAWNTFAGLLRNKIVILFTGIFLCIVLLMMTPMMIARAMAESQRQGMILGLITAILTMVSGFGSLLAAWSAADSVFGEMKSGTILAVMARPVRRWEFLLGKFLGVQILMLAYVLLMVALSFLLAHIGGEQIHSTLWVLIVYPMVRYAIYSALAILLVTVMHPVIAFVIVLIAGVFANLVSPVSMGAMFLPAWLRTGLFYILPSMELLSEDKFLTITEAKLQPMPLSSHLTALAYGLDWALVLFLLAAWSFRRRSLSRE